MKRQARNKTMKLTEQVPGIAPSNPLARVS